MMRSPLFRAPLLASILSITLLLLTSAQVRATNYYVSPSGNDANNGTSQSTAWQSIARVNQSTYTYQPGDRILFQRGGLYRGEITMGSSGSASSPITVGAYGSGDAPVISGSQLLTGWTQQAGNIWVTSVNKKVDQVYIGGQRMTPARYPNTGWLRNTQGGGNQLHSNDLTQPDGYWNGARAIVRSNSSSYDTVVVSNYANGTLTFSTNINNVGSDPWGFFLYKKQSELDTPGEWFYDGTTGQLYLRAPNDANPNTLTVEGSVHWAGVLHAWQRHYQTIENLTFRHQQNAAIRNDGADHVIVTGCTFEKLYHGIRSYGSYDTYSGNTFRNTYATGALIIDNNTTFENNIMTDIALVPGEGETAWGYFGVRSIGQGNVIRSNRLDNIGYTGLEVNGNCLVEKNVVKRALATLNDGGGIAFDNADGLIIRDNIVMDLIGNYDGGAATNEPHNQHMGNGIYFGNTSIKNTKVKRNTVANCPSAGINVDHTMISTGYEVMDNVLFNNGVQLIVSDYSNYNGPSATAPFFVPNFNDVISGNIMYALREGQLTMKHFNCYSATPVDFGTFTNNRYFNPYNELSILVHNIYSGGPKYYTLERWQQERSEDVGSTRSPLRLNGYEVTEDLGTQLLANGTFDANVNGWGGWPTNAQVSLDYTYLDNGALKAHLPDNSVYPEFTLRNPTGFSVQGSNWYRMRFSVQSNNQGQFMAGLKGLSQLPNVNTISKREYPFGPERRDIEFLFQSNLTDQALVEFTNKYTDPTYWLDNVAVQRVNVQAVDPLDRQMILLNDQTTEQEYTLAGCWSDVNGYLYHGTVTVLPYRSMVLVKEADEMCNMSTSIGAVTPDHSSASIYPNPIRRGSTLHFAEGTHGIFTLSALNGAKSVELTIPANTTSVDLPKELAAGLYILRGIDNSSTQQYKLMVE